MVLFITTIKALCVVAIGHKVTYSPIHKNIELMRAAMRTVRDQSRH